MPLSRPVRPRRAVVLVTTAALILGLAAALAPSSGANPTPPPNPSDSQLSAAAAAKNALAARIGVLGAQVAQARADLVALEGRVEYFEQLYALRITQERAAKAAAAKAKARLAASVTRENAAHTAFVQQVQATYIDGMVSSADDSPVALLTAKDPSSLLDASVIAQYATEKKVDAIGQFQLARVARSNDETASRALALAAKKATALTRDARDAAVDAYQARQAQEAALETQVATTQNSLVAAQAQLATLNNQRAAFNAYVAEQKRLAAIRAAKERARKLALARAKAAAAAAAAAARARGNDSGGGGGQSSTASGPSAPAGGSWTAAKGRRAVARARSTLGTPYAWAGGGASGPSYGVCDAGAGAPNDCYVDGYDCSGLAMYAWGINWAHFAATQYWQAGSYHPSRSNLMPGDLVFFGPSQSGIHHVAIYAGGGQIIEAPYSGGYVQYNSLDAYYDYYGATRPLT